MNLSGMHCCDFLLACTKKEIIINNYSINSIFIYYFIKKMNNIVLFKVVTIIIKIHWNKEVIVNEKAITKMIVSISYQLYNSSLDN